jgi:hypothetical protein
MVVRKCRLLIFKQSWRLRRRRLESDERTESPFGKKKEKKKKRKDFKNQERRMRKRGMRRARKSETNHCP